MPRPEQKWRIGIDFDNTIIGYEQSFLSTAREWRLLPVEFSGSKQMIRDAIRQLPDGEHAWQRLQGHVYGRGLAQGTMFAGVGDFLRRCKAEAAQVYIVSHKTEFGHHDPHRVNLRDAARDWMDEQGFFREDGHAIPTENVHFESTRAEKCGRIAQLRCTHFIDDLEEVLTDPLFPPGVHRILFSDVPAVGSAPYAILPNWRAIENAIFENRS